jgi:hypothetical protein
VLVVQHLEAWRGASWRRRAGRRCCRRRLLHALHHSQVQRPGLQPWLLLLKLLLLRLLRWHPWLRGHVMVHHYQRRPHGLTPQLLLHLLHDCMNELRQLLALQTKGHTCAAAAAGSGRLPGRHGRAVLLLVGGHCCGDLLSLKPQGACPARKWEGCLVQNHCNLIMRKADPTPIFCRCGAAQAQQQLSRGDAEGWRQLGV